VELQRFHRKGRREGKLGPQNPRPERPATFWPPHRIETSSPVQPAKASAATTSYVLRQRTISAGLRSTGRCARRGPRRSLRPPGTPDERLAVLPDLFRELLATHPPGLTEDELRQAHDAVPRFEEMCLALAEDGLAETIQHDDLHDGQVFVRDGRYLVFDWGDSCVSHPLISLTVLLRSTAWRLGLEPGGPELRRLRDAYLEPFGRGPEIADIAYWAGTISRAIAWKRMVDPRELEFLSESDLEGPAYGIRLFLAGGPVGSWQEP
jgi:Phosphotransferase enzyme family